MMSPAEVVTEAVRVGGLILRVPPGPYLDDLVVEADKENVRVIVDSGVPPGIAYVGPVPNPPRA